MNVTKKESAATLNDIQRKYIDALSSPMFKGKTERVSKKDGCFRDILLRVGFQVFCFSLTAQEYNDFKDWEIDTWKRSGGLNV